MHQPFDIEAAAASLLRLAETHTKALALHTSDPQSTDADDRAREAARSTLESALEQTAILYDLTRRRSPFDRGSMTKKIRKAIG